MIPRARWGTGLQVPLLIGTLAFGAEEKKAPDSPSRAPVGAKAEKGKAKDSRSPAVRRPLLEVREAFDSKVVDLPVERESLPAPLTE